jgi:predicted amidohydrolase
MSYLTMNPQGDLVHKYNKIHPCVIKRPDLDVTETDACTSGSPGNDNIKLIDVTSPKTGETFRLGFAICYDLRYPKFWMELRDRKADAVIVPACWFFPTRGHWETLLTARAIDNQYYVVCPAQIGVHNESRPPSFGFSMVLDPLGETVVALGKVVEEGGKMDTAVHGDFKGMVDEFPGVGEGTCLGYAEIELKRVEQVRKELPIREYENDVYGDKGGD